MYVIEGSVDQLSQRFDSSKGRGPFQTQIGVGKVIRGIRSSSISHVAGHLHEYVRLGRRCQRDESGGEKRLDYLKASEATCLLELHQSS